MIHRLARAAALAAVALAAAPAHVAAQELKGPPAEIRRGPQLAPPVVPGFELPPEEPGYHNVRELRVRGQGSIGTEITVRGYITWVYDCAKAIAQPGETPAQVQKRIDEDQTRCERPKFYLGDGTDTSPERSIWVVSVPRPPTKMERKRLPKSELDNWPPVPKYAVGDHVAVTGKWELSSPHGDRNSDGLLVFKSLQPAKPRTGAAATPRAIPAPPALATPKVPPAPRATPIDPAKRQQSMKQANEGAKAIGQNQFETAIERYKASVASWPENHSAWFYLAVAYSKKQDWAQAVSAAANAARRAPTQAMYPLMHGTFLYEAAVQKAREAQAAAQGRKPEEITHPDLRSVNQDAALVQLALAIHLNRDLWRAHYYVGRIYRDRGYDSAAAAAFTTAVREAPPQAGPYVALAELYRRWDYYDQAVMVARLGAANVAAPVDTADAYYVLGLALDDKQDHAGAIEAYTKALDARRDLSFALFQRGQAYFRTKDYTRAKADLEAFVIRAPAGFAAGQASRMLMEIAARKP